MKCDEFLSALETGGLVQRLKARCHAARCRRCASQRAKFADAMQRWALPEPLSPHAERLWRQAAGEPAAPPARGNVWKLVTAGAVSGICLIVICLLGIFQYTKKSSVSTPQRTVARNESRHVGPITVEQINPAEGLAYLSNDVERLNVELKELRQRIEKKQVQSQITTTLERFGEPPSPTPE
jgi:hypothetical protein